MEQIIYLADDDANIRELETAFLLKEGFRVKGFSNGDSLLSACGEALPDLVVLDIMMPGMDGFTVCKQLREMSETLPILIVSARDDPYDRVTGLTLGSDDYMIKPFLPLELVARVKGLLRRASPAKATEESILRFGTLQLSELRRTALMEGKALDLTPTEFDFLAYMLKNQDRAVGREEILKSLWQYETDTRAADDLLKRLRKKLRAAGDTVQIETVWGFGFRLTERSDNE